MRRRNRNRLGKVIFVTLFLILLWIFGFYLYTTYQNIEIEEGNYTAERQQYTLSEQTVENEEENSKKVADVIEETTQKVVGISKLKNAGSSIFSNAEESSLGLGTGIYRNIRWLYC